MPTVRSTVTVNQECDAAMRELLPSVYAELRAMAGRVFRRERFDHTLQPTALVHEAFVRLNTDDALRCTGRAMFLAVASRAMRQVLVQHARDRGRLKRGGDWCRLRIEAVDEIASNERLGVVDVVALDEAMDQLATYSEHHARVIEMYYFGGMKIAEIAAVTGFCERTIDEDLRFARAWLRDQLRPAD